MTSTFQRIVCATDFSASSAAAVSQADQLATRLDATLHLLHVVQDPLQEPWAAEAYAMNLDDLTQEWFQTAERDLGVRAEKCSSRTMTACRIGRPVQQILEYVESVKADLLVVGTHGHGFVAHLILGSVAERLVRQSPCPVLTVRDSLRAGQERAAQPATVAAHE